MQSEKFLPPGIKFSYICIRKSSLTIKKNEAMFRFNQNFTVGLPLMVVRLRGLVHS